MYNAGSAALTVVPVFRDIQKKIVAEMRKAGIDAGKAFSGEFNRVVNGETGHNPLGPSKADSAKQGADAGSAFANGFKRRVDAALATLPDIKLDVDSSDADVKLAEIRAELQFLSDKRIGVDIDAGKALADLDRLRGELDRLSAESPDVGVKVDAALASNQLAAVQAQVDKLAVSDATVKVDADTGSARANLASVGNEASASTSRMGNLIAAGISLGPLIAPAAAVAAGAIVTIGAAALSGAAGIGVLALGFSGVGDAVKALGAAQADAGKNAQRAALQQMQVASAVDGVRSAEAALANTRASAADGAFRAAQQVQDAERNLAGAQADARAAQVALTQAREDAKRAIEDLNRSVRQGSLDQRQAALDQKKAKQELDKVLADPRASELQRQQAKLSYDQTVQRVEDVRVRNLRLAAEKAKADKAGVNGSKQVQGAIQGVQRANEGVRGAQQQVADAVRAQTSQQRQSAFAIAQAQQSLVSAQRSLAQATAQTGAEGSASMEKLRKAMDALSPAGQRFALFLFGLKPLFDRVKAAAEGGLLPGVEAGIRSLMPLLPSFTSFVGGLAKVMGDLFKQAGQALQSPFWRLFFDYISRTAGPAIQSMAAVLGSLAKVFVTLLIAFEPVQKQMGAGLVKLTADFANFVTKAVGSKGFSEFIDYILRNGPVIAALFGNLVKIVGKLLVAFAPLGEAAVRVLGAIADGLARLSPTALLAVAGGIGLVVAALGGPVAATVAAIVAALGLFAGAFTMVWKASQTFRDNITSSIDTVKVVFRSVWDFVRGILQSWGVTTDGIKSVVVRAFEVVSAGWSALADNLALRWYTVVKPALEQLNKVVLFMWHNVTGPFFKFLAGAVTGLGVLLQQAYSGVQQLLQSTAGGQQLAADRVRQSELNLSSAVRDAKTAQVELTQARRDAKQALEDLNSKVINAALNERQASLSVKQAKQELDRVKADGSADTLQRQQAQLTFDQAVQHEKDVRAETAQTKAEKAAADKKGVEGSDQVKAAAERQRAELGKVRAAEEDLHKKRTAQNEAQKGQVNGFGAFLLSVYNGVIAPVWNAIKGVITGAWAVIKIVFDAMKAHLVTTLGPAFTWFLDHVIKPVWTGVRIEVSVAWAAIKIIFGIIQINLKALGAAFVALWKFGVQPAFNGMKTVISTVWEKGIKPIFNALGGFIRDKVAPAFKSGVDAIGKAWDAIRDKAKGPVRFVVNTVINGALIDGFNSVAAKFGVAKVARVTLPKGFSSGGVLPGYQPGVDSVPAMLSPGEGVLVPEAVRQLGPARLLAWNKRARAGASIEHFAGGGIVGLLTKFAKRSGINFQITSGYRQGDRGYHGRGQAIDMASSNSGMDRLATWLAKFTPAITELIHQSSDRTSRWGVKNGRNNPGAYASLFRSSNLSRAHINHVHLAMTAGGVAKALLGKVGSFISSAKDWLGEKAQTALGWAQEHFLGPVREKVSGLLESIPGGDTMVGQLARGAGSKLLDGAMSVITGKAEAQDGGEWISANGPGGLGAWIAAAIRATGVPGSWAGGPGKTGLYTLIMRESGGNPRAQNNWDSNAAKGQASRGLMQTIPSTFAAHRLKTLPNDIFNPVANIAAGIRYILSRYGSIFNVQQANPARRPMGYDSGGYLPPGLSTVWNGTGRPEPVLTSRQFSEMSSSTRSGGTFMGELYMQDGSFMGKVRGEMERVADSTLGQYADAITYGMGG